MRLSDAARELLESDGLAALTMQAVALRVGVRAPSLYKRVQSRDDLIRLVAEASLTELADRLNSAPNPVELANRFRAFGHERPAAFQLIMTPGAGPGCPARIPGRGERSHSRPRRRVGRPGTCARGGPNVDGLGGRFRQHGAERQLQARRRCGPRVGIRRGRHRRAIRASRSDSVPVP